MTCTNPCVRSSLASRKNSENTQTAKAPTIAITMAQVGIARVVTLWFVTVHWEPMTGNDPTGVMISVRVQWMSPMLTSTGSGMLGGVYGSTAAV